MEGEVKSMALCCFSLHQKLTWLFQTRAAAARLSQGFIQLKNLSSWPRQGKKKTLRQRNKVIKDNTRLCVEKLKPSEEHNLGGFHVISTDTALLEEHCSSDLFKAKHLEKKRFTQGLIFHLNVKQDISPVLHRPSLLLITITLVEPITMSSFLWAAIDAIICTEKSRWWPSGGRQKFHQAWLPQQLQKFQTHNLH